MTNEEKNKMITYRELKVEETEKFWEFMNTLDQETEYMMYEPGERKECSSLDKLRANVKNAVEKGDFLFIAEENKQLVGFLWAERGQLHRIAHTAYIVAGILKDYRGQGIGTSLFKRLNDWAKQEKIVRLELTVECQNEAAFHLYQKNGFKVEGKREKSMYVNGTYVDEYYMAKIL